MGHQDIRHVPSRRPRLLATSFKTWKPDQCSNSSDDLLVTVKKYYKHADGIQFLQRLPVDFEHAHQRVIQAIQRYRPDAIICCGMGETRSHLCLEDRAHYRGSTCYTTLQSIDRLAQNLAMTRVSQDAGQFVCNHLYGEVLNYVTTMAEEESTMGKRAAPIPCIFVHVPVLTDENRRAIVAAFFLILDRIQHLVRYPRSLDPSRSADPAISA